MVQVHKLQQARSALLCCHCPCSARTWFDSSSSPSPPDTTSPGKAWCEGGDVQHLGRSVCFQGACTEGALWILPKAVSIPSALLPHMALFAAICGYAPCLLHCACSPLHFAGSFNCRHQGIAKQKLSSALHTRPTWLLFNDHNMHCKAVAAIQSEVDGQKVGN